MKWEKGWGGGRVGGGVGGAEFSYYVLKKPAFSRGAANTKNLLIFYEILQEMKCGYLDKINLPRLIMLRYCIDLLQTTDYSYLLQTTEKPLRPFLYLLRGKEKALCYRPCPGYSWAKNTSCLEESSGCFSTRKLSGIRLHCSISHSLKAKPNKDD